MHFVCEPDIIDTRDGEEITVGVAEYLAFWGCDPCYDRAPRLHGDGYIFYNYGPEEDSRPYLKDQLLPALKRQLQDPTLSPLDRENFEKIVAYVKDCLDGVPLMYTFTLKAACPLCGKQLDTPGSVLANGGEAFVNEDGILAEGQDTDLILDDPNPSVVCNHCNGNLYPDAQEE